MNRHEIPENSVAMAFFRQIGMDSIAWALRRLHCPVGQKDLVLEVGSGGNPYARANILLDAYEETRERHWAPLIADRKTVLGFVENLPFRDKCFDFVIASHVLEHSSDPALFISELQRVAKAGYIEVPDAFMERINPYKDHRLEITVRDAKLFIRKKESWIVEQETVDLYEHRAKRVVTGELMPSRPFEFHVRYYWQDKIDFEVINPETDASWVPMETSRPPVRLNPGLLATIKGRALKIFRRLLSQTQRNKNIDLLSLLMCPECSSDRLLDEQSSLRCGKCDARYPVRNGIPILNISARLKKD